VRARRLLSVLATLVLGVPATIALAQERTIAPGQSATGDLTASDPTTRGRRAPYHIWTLDGHRGQRITIDLMASEFDPYLVLRDEAGYPIGSDDDSGEGNNARLHVVLPRDGRYSIVVTAFNEMSRGRYTLAVTSWDVPNAPAPGATSSLTIGTPVDGVLEPGDEIAGDGPFQDRWTVDARAGQRLRVDMHSGDFDSYLVLLDPAGQRIAYDDDSGEGNDASLGFRAATAGRYTILATSYQDTPQVGAYRLTLSEETGNFADPGAVAVLAPGPAQEGRLETGDATGNRGLEDRWTFDGRAGQLARIDVISSSFDTYAVLLQNGTPLDSNDDGGEGNNSRLTTILPRSGSYTVAVSAYAQGSAGGRYTVQLAFSEPPAGAGRVERLQFGRTASGRLEAGDRPRSGGGYQDQWEFDGRQNQNIMLEMRSSDFDAYLELRDADGNLVAENDDGGDGTNALISARLTRNGRYRVIARSYGERESTGFYELTLTNVGDVAAPAQVVTLTEGQTVFGRLEAGDSVIGDSTYADAFTFRAPRDGDVTIDLRSSEFDAYLIVQDAEGATLATDDDSGEGTDARVSMHMERGHSYRILANSYGEDRQSGTYRIALRYAQP